MSGQPGVKVAAHANSATGHAGTETSLLVCSRSLQQIHRPLLALSAQASAQHIAETEAFKIVHDFGTCGRPASRFSML